MTLVKPKVSILIPTYKRPDLLSNAINSVTKCTKDISLEFIILDNEGSTELSSRIIQSSAAHLRHQYQIIAGKNEGNFSTMNNEMAKAANGDYLLFLNNDVQGIENVDFIATMLGALEKDASIGCVGATLVYPDRKLQHCGIAFTSSLEPFNVGTEIIKRYGLFPEIYAFDREYNAATAACLMMRAKDFQLINGFNPAYNWCYDDVDLCLRVKKLLGKKIVVKADAVAVHRESQSKANPNIPAMFKLFRNDWEAYLKPDAMAYRMDYLRYESIL